MAGSVTPPLGGSAWLRAADPTAGGARGDAMAAESGRLPRVDEDGPKRVLVFVRDREPGETVPDEGGFGDTVPDDGGFGESSFEVDCLSSFPPSESLLLPNSFDINLL